MLIRANWCGEFGRTPDNGLRGGSKSYGRDHNAKAMTMWFAGGAVRAGQTQFTQPPFFLSLLFASNILVVSIIMVASVRLTGGAISDFRVNGYR